MNLYVEPRVPVGAEPLRGSFFVTEGKIFPAGTIPGVNGDQFDPNAITSSIGRWFCKGTFLVSGSVFDKSPVAVLTDQLLLFPNDTQSIATTGTEGAGIAVRPVIGGTGQYAGYTGAEAGVSRVQQDRRCQPAGHDQTSENNEFSITSILNDRKEDRHETNVTECHARGRGEPRASHRISTTGDLRP